jgi:hypothetical protein
MLTRALRRLARSGAEVEPAGEPAPDEVWQERLMLREPFDALLSTHGLLSFETVAAGRLMFFSPHIFATKTHL